MVAKPLTGSALAGEPKLLLLLHDRGCMFVTSGRVESWVGCLVVVDARATGRDSRSTAARCSERFLRPDPESIFDETRDRLMGGMIGQPERAGSDLLLKQRANT